MKRITIAALLSPIFLCLITLSAFSEQKKDWLDTYYQYRIPVALSVEIAGWNEVPIGESSITSAIDKLEEYQFDPLFLAYNQLKIVEVNRRGKVIDANPTAGFHLIPASDELFQEKLTGQNQTITIPTEKGAYYLLRFVNEGAGSPPTIRYEQIFPIGTPARTHAYMSSYMPRLLPKKRMTHECLLQSDGQPMSLTLKSRFITGLKSISVKKVKIMFLANFKKPGTKNLMLYYQPTDAQYLKIPELRQKTLPQQAVNIKWVGPAKKYIGKTKYSLGSNSDFALWFADTTVKLTPNTPVPKTKSKRIHITCAKNEAQSFQVVMSTKKAFDFEKITITPLSSGKNKIGSENIDIRAIEYVPVTKKAVLNQVKFFENIGDPLVAMTPKRISPKDGAAWWVTVKASVGTPAGTYNGKLTIHNKGKSSMSVPLSLTVYDFELPEYSTFHTLMGGQYMAKNSGIKELKTIMQYHGLKGKAELKKLARKYYDLMAKNKFYPKSVVLFSEIGMKWSPPPEGYNVDKPRNYFRLYDWDFTEFNNDLKHYIDDLKVNSVCLTHTNPSVSHLFKHLPGKVLKDWEKDPGHVTMAWQTFRETTKVTWREGQSDEWVKITQGQWDRLLLDYYRAMAKNLEENGWLDKFYILGDESSGVENMVHLVKLLKSDPLTAKIRFSQCLQSLEWMNHQEDGEYIFTEYFTYVPQVDENYNRWEEYFWDDYGVPRDRDNLWSYAAYCSRLGINTPGMTNREIGLDIFNKGGSGYVIWDTIMWWHAYGKDDDPHNPWVEPYSRLANGGLSYFYPPSKKGLSPKPDFTITPSLRVMTYRESVDDYEYARILEDLIAAGEKKGVDVSAGRQIIKDIARMFPSSVEWTLNDAWYLDLRERMAGEILKLKQAIK